MIQQLTNHSNYDADDLSYLRGKGWTDAEILARWDKEANAGKPACRWSHPIAQAKLAAVRGS